MTEAVQLALIASAAPTLVALTGIILGLKGRRRLQKENATADKKLDHITQLTNSTLTAANKRIEDLEIQLAGIKALFSEDSRRALIEQIVEDKMKSTSTHDFKEKLTTSLTAAAPIQPVADAKPDAEK